jgi:hypothetical protein
MRAAPDPVRPRDRRRALAAVDAAVALLVVILIAQMWVLGASLEAYLAGHRGSAIAGAIASTALFAGAVGLYAFLHRVDRDAR